MATATKKTTKAMTPSELKAAIENLKPAVQTQAKAFMESMKGKKRRSYSKASKEELSLARSITKDKAGSYRLAEEVLKLTARNGMSAYDALKKKAKKTA